MTSKDQLGGTQGSLGAEPEGPPFKNDLDQFEF